jgi:hypothetical protein
MLSCRYVTSIAGLFSMYLLVCVCQFRRKLILILPPQHWHNLRKHNGERYAYSSHSQAVLDCLRNRHEWAQLVDRGPKVCMEIFFNK